MSPMRQQRCYTFHYNDVIMGAMASQITSLTIINSTVYSGVAWIGSHFRRNWAWNDPVNFFSVHLTNRYSVKMATPEPAWS